MTPSPTATTTARSLTRSVRIECPPEAVFAFVADPANWPRWAIVNVLSIRPSREPDWWDMTTPHGPGRLRLRTNARYGILDQDFVDPQASWTVPARVVPNGGGAEFLLTFFQPPTFSDTVFDQQIQLVDIELAKLKELLEAPRTTD